MLERTLLRIHLMTEHGRPLQCSRLDELDIASELFQRCGVRQQYLLADMPQKLYWGGNVLSIWFR